MSISRLKEAALEYVSVDGWKIFPLFPGTKDRPATPHGFQDASNDPAQIEKWWTENPDYNIGMCPADQGLAVIDWDAHKGHPMIEVPLTYEVETPSGGTHFYYRGSLPPTVEKLAPGIDTRGLNSYVVIPPSSINGREYTAKNNQQITTLPAGIAERLRTRNNRLESTSADVDLPINVDRARHRLNDLRSRGDVAISGMGGNDRTYQLSAELIRDFGLSSSTTLRLIQEPGGWNDACQPPWSQPELEIIIAHAAEYGQNGDGAYAVASIEEVFRDTDLGQKIDNTRSTKPAFRIYSGREMGSLPEPEWIIPELIPARSIGIFSAPKGSFKTFLALDISLAIATGADSFAGPPVEAGAAYYGAHEGFDVIGKVHYPAWCAYHELDPNNDNGFYLMRGPKIANGDAVPFAEAINDHVQKTGVAPRLITLDTYSRSMFGLDENSPLDVNKFVDFAYSLIENWPGCSLIVPAHKGKDSSRGTRGSSAFEYAADFVIDLDRKEHSSLVEVRVRHQRSGKERDMPWSLQGRNVNESLVFEPIAGSDLSALQRVVNMYDYRNVSHILRKMGATNDNIAITTHALATTMTAREENDSEEVYNTKIRAAENVLQRLGRNKLKALRIGEGKAMRWVVKVSSLEDELYLS